MKKLLKILGWIIVFAIVFCLSGKIYGYPSGIELQDMQPAEQIVSVFPVVVELGDTGLTHIEWTATVCFWLFFIAGIFVWLSLYDVEWSERIRRGFFSSSCLQPSVCCYPFQDDGYDHTSTSKCGCGRDACEIRI